MKNHLFVSAWICLATQAMAQEKPLPLPQLLPKPLETALALSAAPEHLRDEASVYLLERGGYVLARQGSNGFVCLVRRAGVTPSVFYDIIAPMCFDAEGSKTLLPAIFEQTRLLEAKKNPAQVLAKIEAGFADGTYQTPRAGINYMLSAANFLPDRRNPGHVFHYLPHWMFHAPGMSRKDAGQAERLNIFGQEAFVTPPGKPWSFLVVPMGKTEREQVAKNQADLVAKAKTYVRFAKAKQPSRQ